MPLSARRGWSSKYPLLSPALAGAAVLGVAAALVASCGGSNDTGPSRLGTAGAGAGDNAGSGFGDGANASANASGVGGASGANSGSSTASTGTGTGGAGGAGGSLPMHMPNEPISIPTQAWSHGLSDPVYQDGAPIGGLGAGSITWRFDGAFYHDRLNIGSATQTVDPNAGFFMFQHTGTAAPVAMPLDQTLGANQATYSSLFPRSFVDYSGSAFPCKVKVEQYSPIIAGDYQHTSYPVGVYRWQIDNPTNAPCDVAVMLTWKNDHGGNTASVQMAGNDVGLVLGRGATNATSAAQGEFTLASRNAANVTVTYQSAPTVQALRTQFSNNGLLANTTGSDALGAIAFKATLQPNEETIVPIVLAWDIPIAQSGTGKGWYREYTRYYPRTGLSSWTIANDALTQFEPWLWAIEDWQTSVLSDAKVPDWMKGPLFNELYYYFIAGTYWEAGAASGQADNPNEDMFTSLESYVYPFYGTSDVRFYGSWALAQLWPNIDKQEVMQFCDSVTTTRTDRPAPIGTTAHDFGTTGTVFAQWNAYTYRDSTKWKDLNSKLTLMVYRDWALTGKTDQKFLDYCWPAVQMAMQKVKSQDSDADGLPNSTGVDQTYDDMDLQGNTAYCGSLFLAATEAATAIATAENDSTLAATYQSWLTQGKASFESELWTGTYYKIDTGSTDTTRIMDDQLAGEWYARTAGLPPIVDPAHATSAFMTIYQNNFQKFANGSRGVVNVMTAAGAIDPTSSQTQECWVGTSWGVASAMIEEGLSTQATDIGKSLVNTIWNTDALWFRTPEAWTQAGVIRAPYYMRANTLWAAKRAFDISP